jgi:aminopeptidase N
MSAKIEIPRGDSLTLTFHLKNADGTPAAFDAARLEIDKAKADGTDYKLDADGSLDGLATFEIPKGELAKEGSFPAAVIAWIGADRQHTLSVTVNVLRSAEG